MRTARAVVIAIFILAILHYRFYRFREIIRHILIKCIMPTTSAFALTIVGRYVIFASSAWMYVFVNYSVHIITSHSTLLRHLQARQTTKLSDIRRYAYSYTAAYTYFLRSIFPYPHRRKGNVLYFLRYTCVYSLCYNLPYRTCQRPSLKKGDCLCLIMFISYFSLSACIASVYLDLSQSKQIVFRLRK